MLESWQTVFRTACTLREKGAYRIPTKGLEALSVALETDALDLIQCATVWPPVWPQTQGWPCCAACLLAYLGWKGLVLPTVGAVEIWFSDLCVAINEATGKSASCRLLMNDWDSRPRPDVLRDYLAEVRRALEEREAEPAELIAS